MPLKLHEELFLLALREREGTTHGVAWPTAVGAALLAELVEAGRVDLRAEGKKLFVEPRDPRPLGEPLLDECLAKVTAAKRRAQAALWIVRFAGVKRLPARIAQELCRQGVLRADERTVLLLFRRQIYPEADPRPEREVRERLRRLVFAETTQRDPRTLLLLSLADAVGLLPLLFEKRQLKERGAWVAQLVADEPLGRRVRGILETQRTAAIAAAT
ncbi:MAG: GOLPH3/VPS74 family protein [Candidatus Krumholzibacteriia bacterium]